MKSGTAAKRVNAAAIGLLLSASVIYHVRMAIGAKNQPLAHRYAANAPEQAAFCQAVLPFFPLFSTKPSLHHKPI